MSSSVSHLLFDGIQVSHLLFDGIQQAKSKYCTPNEREEVFEMLKVHFDIAPDYLFYFGIVCKHDKAIKYAFSRNIFSNDVNIKYSSDYC